MNIFTKLEHLNDLTESEKIIVDYIKNNPETFIKMSAVQISKTCFYECAKKNHECASPIDMGGVIFYNASVWCKRRLRYQNVTFQPNKK